MDRFQAVFLLSCILASSYSLAQADEQSDIIPGFSLLPFSPLDPLFVPQTNSSRDTEGATQDFLGLWKRQTCPSGYGYCSNLGTCCPADDRCCPSGCLPPGWDCCDTGLCPSGWECCGAYNCNPVGSQCCANGGWCEAGNGCVLVGATGEVVCCTNLDCTAYVSGGTTIGGGPGGAGSGTRSPTPIATTPTSPASVTVPQTTPTPPQTSALVTNQYPVTISWSYYSYYYDAILTESITSTEVYTWTIIYVQATDAAEATSLAAAVSQTIVFSTPFAATVLEGQATEQATASSTQGTTTATGIPIVTAKPQSRAPELPAGPWSLWGTVGLALCLSVYGLQF